MTKTLHVVPTGDGWHVTEEAEPEAGNDTYPSEDLATEAADLALQARGGGELVIHSSDGEIREKRIVGVVDTEDIEG